MKSLAFKISAFVLGLGLVLSQSSFRTLNTPNYGFDQSTSTWVSLPAAGEGTAPHQYQCIDSSNQCTAFASADPNTDPDSIDESSITLGDYSVNP